MTPDDEDVIDVLASSPEDLRAEAASRREAEAGLRASAKYYRQSAAEESREADRCALEAKLLAEAAVALDVLHNARAALAGVEARAEGLLAARRAAEDRCLQAKRNHDRRLAEEKRLAGRADVSFAARDEAAVRTARAAASLAEQTPKRDAAQREHDQAEQAVTACKIELSRAETAWETAAWRAQYPPAAARTEPILLGGAGVADMTEEEQGLIGMLALAMAGSASHEAHQPDPVAAYRDKTKFRTIPGRNGTAHILPPAMQP